MSGFSTERGLTSLQRTYSRYVFVVAIVTCLVAVTLWATSDGRLPRSWSPRDFYNSYVAPDQASATFARLLPDYYSSVKALEANLTIQCVIVLLALMIATQTDLTKPKQQFKVPVISAEIDADWLHVLLPLLQTYLWLHFGMALDHVIRQRMLLWDLCAYRNHAASIVDYAQANALNRPGFLDAWFMAFREGHHSIVTSLPWVSGFLTDLAYGGILGMSHASVFALSLLGFERFEDRRVVGIACKSIALVSPLLYVGTHALFAYAGQNPNHMQFAIATVACLGTVGILRIADNPGGL